MRSSASTQGLCFKRGIVDTANGRPALNVAAKLSQEASVNQAAMSSRLRVNAGAVLGDAVEQVDVTKWQGGQ